MSVVPLRPARERPKSVIMVWLSPTDGRTWFVDHMSWSGDSAAILWSGADRGRAVAFARQAAAEHDAELSLGDAA